MKKIEPGQLVSTIANIGVLGGILLLAYELNQNNELMYAEARINRANMAINAWQFFAENGELAELRDREKRGDDLSAADTRRIDAAVMAIFVFQEWTFQELSVDASTLNQTREVMSYDFAHKPEYRRVWGLRKFSFDPDFVRWVDDHVISE